MKRVLKSRLSVLSAFAVLAVAGCGGGGNNPSPSANGAINYEGVPAASGFASESTPVPATGGATVSTGEGDVLIPSGAVAGGSTVSSETPLAIFPAGIGFPGTYAAGSTLRVNGVTNSGAATGTDGLTDTALAFPVSTEGTLYTLSFPAGALNTTRDLNVGRFDLVGRWYIFFEPLSFSIPVPTSIEGTLPQNGQNARGADVVATFIGCNGRTATLRVVYGGGTGFVLQQTRTIEDGQVRFTNLTEDSVPVPNSGVESVTLTVGDL